MKIQQFLEHHGIARNPFADEDAQSDPVFKDHCILDTYHPAWDKIFGDPREPSTSVVFGEKGAGKTAMRLQIAKHMDQFNRQHSDNRLFIIQYDDFNPFLDHFVGRMPSRRRRIDKALANWRLWDHMDAILSIGVTQLVDDLLGSRAEHASSMSIRSEALTELDRHQRRDLLLLAACYDQSNEQPYLERIGALRRRLRFWTIRATIPFCIGVISTLIIASVFGYLFFQSEQMDSAKQVWDALPKWFYPAAMLLGWLPWIIKWCLRMKNALSITRGMRVVERSTNRLRRALMRFTSGEINGQPLPNRHSSDDRYELLQKLQSLLQSLGFGSIFILVDRVDEPYLINGSADLMKALIWPMLDNKFLKHPGIGVKMMLPSELKYYVEREDRDFAQRARLDKQNMIPSLAWTGEALFDVANARLRACAESGRTPDVQGFFDPAVTGQRLLDGLRTLRVPRHLFKFLYLLLVAHCNAHTDNDPAWKISRERFESELALYQRDMAEERA